ncbi:hypothetical protein B0T24DRAFT_679700 [Lasiosphaeria ovina]|uniref:Uncharacterized protein n=1 Tax=Lasiosphaeria ovina TaxID=92902 RepID=A0AAE0KCT6_9PEZI|nr:hypothetical protein B0T24DRAFT_679700 [Lasiosphaeria ovina]
MRLAKDGDLAKESPWPAQSYSTMKEDTEFLSVWYGLLKTVFIQIRVGGTKPPRWAEISFINPMYVVLDDTDILNADEFGDCVAHMNNLFKPEKVKWEVKVAQTVLDLPQIKSRCVDEASGLHAGRQSRDSVRGFGTVNGDAVVKALTELENKRRAGKTNLKSFSVKNTHLTADKIKAAVDKRDFEDGQNKVMGDKSASEESLILKSTSSQGEDQLTWCHETSQNLLKYKVNQMLKWLYMSEWLHLSAFSWGGMLGDDPKYKDMPAYATSQVPENLVLGTSETNSLMTRHPARVRLADANGDYSRETKLLVNPIGWQQQQQQEPVNFGRLPGSYPISTLLNRAKAAGGFLTYTIDYNIQPALLHRDEATLDDRLFALCKKKARMAYAKATKTVNPAGGQAMLVEGKEGGENTGILRQSG